MKTAGLGGAPVPATVAGRLAELGVHVFRSYGSTEHPSITLTPHDAPAEKRLSTDGIPRPGVEIRVAADGEIFSRGPDLCLGYLDEALTKRAFDDDGWYHTGNVGVLDDDGYLTITDRKADIIIRGGENISALEVEEVLLAMAAVAEAVVVAVPDARLGEHAAAVLRTKPGRARPTLEEIRAHFERMGVAKQKWPEELFEVDDYPRTASGKVQKHLVRREMQLKRTGGSVERQETCAQPGVSVEINPPQGPIHLRAPKRGAWRLRVRGRRDVGLLRRLIQHITGKRD